LLYYEEYKVTQSPVRVIVTRSRILAVANVVDDVAVHRADGVDVGRTLGVVLGVIRLLLRGRRVALREDDVAVLYADVEDAHAARRGVEEHRQHGVDDTRYVVAHEAVQEPRLRLQLQRRIVDQFEIVQEFQERPESTSNFFHSLSFILPLIGKCRDACQWKSDITFICKISNRLSKI
jgi:hypothetical protein